MTGSSYSLSTRPAFVKASKWLSLRRFFRRGVR